MQPAISPLARDETEDNADRIQPAFFVLVLHNQDDVFADVYALENRLFRLAFFASITIASVLACMGYFVYRLLKSSKSRLTQSSLNEKSSETFAAFPTIKYSDKGL